MIKRLESLIDLAFSKKTYRYYSVFNLFIIILLLLGVVYLKYNPIEIFKYFLFQIFYVILPGLFLYHCLFRFKGNVIDKITLGYAIGISLTIIEYFVFYSLNFQKGILFVGPVISIIGLIHLLWNYKNIRQNLLSRISGIPVQFYSIYLLLLFATFMGFIMTSPLPSPANSFYLDLDILFDIGNTEGLKRGFPLINPRINNVEFYYQFFTSIHLAVQSYITNIHPVLITIRFFPFFDMLFLAFAVFHVGKKFFGSDRYALSFAFIFFFTNSAASVMEYGTSGMFICNFLFKRLFLLPRGVELAISFILVLFGILYDALKAKRISWNLIFLSSILFFVLTGVKSPVSSVYFISINLLLFIMILTSRFSKNYLIYTILLSSVFIGVYLLLYSHNNHHDSGVLYFKIGSLIRETYLFGFFDTLQIKEFYKNIIYIILIPVFLFSYLPFAMPLFLIQSVSYIKNKLSISCINIFAVIAAFCGIFLGIFIQEVGRSNSYFIETAIPFISLIALSWLIKNYRTLKNRFKVLLFAAFFLSISSTSVLYFKTVQWATRPMRKPATFYNTEKRAMVLTYFEYEGLLWLYKNTESDAVISSDRHFRSKDQTGGASWFYYSAFSDRQFYLEGWGYQRDLSEEQLDRKLSVCNLLYGSETQNRGLIMKENGIDYMIVSEFVHPNLSFADDSIQLVYQNQDIKIYKRAL